MITSYHHVSINGVKYRLAEDAEGDHYLDNRQPLRLQTGAVVQGDSNKFQLRPDILEWRLTDWSGGEGAIKYKEDEPNRYWEGHNIDPFDEVGKLKLARGFEVTNNVSDTDLGKSLQLTKGLDGLWGASIDSNGLYQWDPTNERWMSPVTNGEAGFAAGQWGPKAITGDFGHLFLREDGVQGFWSYDGTTFEEHNTDVPGTGDAPFTNLGLAVFVARRGVLSTAGVYEVLKTGTAPVASTYLLDLGESGLAIGHNHLAAGNNRVYLAQTNADESVIWRIVPSTAASVGFGEEILRQNGLKIETIWHHMGVLFLAGRVGGSGDDRQRVIMYLRGSEVGVLANLRDGTDSSDFVVATQSQEFEKAYFLAKYGPGDATHEWTLFVINLISGAVAGTTVINLQDASNQPQTLVSHNGEQFFGTNGENTTFDETIRVLKSTFVSTSSVTARLDTSIHDFGIVDEKILLSIRLATEPLPSGCSVQVQYQLDQDGTWRTAGTYQTTNGTGTNYTISTSGTVRTFRNIQLRLILGNNGTTSNTPVVLSVGTRATVAAGIKLFQLLLDIADDVGAASGEHTSGEDKLANIKTAGDAESVVEFLDGYPYPAAGSYDSYDVVIDDYQNDLDRPGEGTSRVVLREVT